LDPAKDAGGVGSEVDVALRGKPRETVGDRL
jgi:hypothetical protein